MTLVVIKIKSNKVIKSIKSFVKCQIKAGTLCQFCLFSCAGIISASTQIIFYFIQP